MSRADRVAARLAEREADALLVTDLVNIRYLTGFTGTAAMAIVGPETRRFITDFRYVERAQAEVEGFEQERAPQEPAAALKSGWPDGPVRLGFEDQHLSVRQHQRLRELLPDRIELVAAGGLVEAERARKEPARGRRGSALRRRLPTRSTTGCASAAWSAAPSARWRSGLEEEMRRRGASDPSFPSIVASGPHGALPHAEPREVEIPAGVLVTLDLGCRLDGYCSDCTRTWATGELDDDLAEIYDLVLRAQQTALDAVRPGPTGREIDAVARDLIAAEGHGDHFGHGLGHGVGLEVHEAPRLARSGTDALEAGNVVTVEPGVYVPGRGGVRIEDLVLITENGRDVLSSSPKALTSVK